MYVKSRFRPEDGFFAAVNRNNFPIFCVFAEKCCGKQQQDFPLWHFLYQADVQKIVFGIGVRAEHETAAFIARVHESAEKDTGEKDGRFFVQTQRNRNGFQICQISERCGEIDEFADLEGVERFL